MRALALDVGERRIGVASGDTETGIAVPAGVIDNTPDSPAQVLREAQARGASVVVVGMPYSMSGRVGPQAEVVREFIRRLEGVGLEVETVDERLSSAEAERALAGGRPRGRGRRRPEKGAVDAAAAAVVLQAWLDGKRGAG
ncbi:MAG: Holliday junction resolvase RuvX [Chloroflexota bacterium]|nr:Holliday junction resolvase RuvX [Chloroflexota bacterium]MDE2884878.1 Holliday junction resolvase RuvX [Chloroflexota bacterium]